MMNKSLLLLLGAFGVSTLMTACGQTSPSLHTNTEEECMVINKKLLKIDTFITTVEGTSAFHLEEAALALDAPNITSSNNKRQMLKDAADKKAALQVEHQKLGCETLTK